MASAASNVSVVAVPALGDVWASGQEVRPGTADDADAVAQWRSDTAAVNGALKEAVEALRSGSSETIVYVVEDAQLPIGVLTIGWKAPYLQLVFIDEPYRRGDVGTKATCVVVDEFFQSRPEEQWLGVTTPISAAGEHLLLRLGVSSLGSRRRRSDPRPGLPPLVSGKACVEPPANLPRPQTKPTRTMRGPPGGGDRWAHSRSVHT